MKLSIITTLYKSEPYIRKCLNSLLQQDLSYSDYELVIVDDGSPDNCVEIVKEYQINYPNIVLISQENMGLPEARNTGLKNVSGTYVTFVDPDDYVEPNVYGTLLEKIEKEELDILRYNYTMVEEGTYNHLPKFKETLLTVNYQDEIVDGETFLGERLGFACYVWQFIFKYSLLKDHNITFREKVFDDSDLLPRVLMHASKVTSINRNVYYYVIRKGSLVNVVNKAAALKKINGLFFIIDVYNLYYTQTQNIKAKRWFQTTVTKAYITLLQTVVIFDYENRNEYIKRFNEINKLSLTSSKRIWKKKWHILMAKFNPKFYCRLFYIVTKLKKIVS